MSWGPRRAPRPGTSRGREPTGQPVLPHSEDDMTRSRHRPSAFERAGRLRTPLVWGTLVLSLTLAAGAAWGQVPRRAKGAIDARQAVRIAERFVRENGYTDFVPVGPRRLVPESIEFSRDPRVWLKER